MPSWSGLVKIGDSIMNKLLASTALCFVMAATSFAQDPNLHIYIAYGQSNMSGQATVTDKDRKEDPRFLVLRAANHSGQKVGEFYPAAPPMGHSQSKVGIVDIFGRTMVEKLPDSIKVAVTNIAIGGQSIDLFDKDRNKSYVQNAKNKGDTWWIQYLDEYGGDLYKRIIEMGKIAKQKGVIKGFLFHQGEADYQMNDWPKRVKKVYDDIIKELELDPEKTPILIGELAPTGDLGWRNDAVKQAADLIPNGHLISAQGCPALKEASYTLHFTREGYETFGKRYAETMLEILKKQAPPPDTSRKDTTAKDTTVKDTTVKDTTVKDSSKTDTTAIDSSMALREHPTALPLNATKPKMYFDAKEQSMFIRVEKNGIIRRYRVTGSQNIVY